jgi:mono/diheme cytochrome c family protein
MAGWTNVLAPEEISAMLTLIQRWDEVPTGAIPAPDVPIPTTEESIALGADLFSVNCSRCHGPEGQGKPIAPSLNYKSFLTETSDIALQQIITLGVPGTAMPAWGDRMTEAQIQAIVGFIRQWEATAPEVAQPMGPASGGGGPPWMRNNTTTTGITGSETNLQTPQASNPNAANPSAQATAIATHQASGTSGGGGGQGQGGGQPRAQSQGGTQTSTSGGLDWRVLALITGVLAVAFALAAVGFSSLKRTRPNPPST